MLHRDCSVVRFTLVASVVFTETLVVFSNALIPTGVFTEVSLAFYRDFSVVTSILMLGGGAIDI